MNIRGVRWYDPLENVVNFFDVPTFSEKFVKKNGIFND